MDATKELKVGDVVVYHDPVARPQNALVQAIWGPTCINVVIVSADESRTDSYGRQIEHRTSLSHKSVMNVHGNYWRLESEEPNPIVAPVSK